MFTNGPFFRVFVVMFTLQESWIRSYDEISAQKLCKVTSNEQSRNFEILELESFSFKRRTVHTTYLQFDTSLSYPRVLRTTDHPRILLSELIHQKAFPSSHPDHIQVLFWILHVTLRMEWDSWLRGRWLVEPLNASECTVNVHSFRAIISHGTCYEHHKASNWYFELNCKASR